MPADCTQHKRQTTTQNHRKTEAQQSKDKRNTHQNPTRGKNTKARSQRHMGKARNRTRAHHVGPNVCIAQARARVGHSLVVSCKPKRPALATAVVALLPLLPAQRRHGWHPTGMQPEYISFAS